MYRGTWQDRGVILQSSLNERAKGILALHEDKHQRVVPLLKPLIRRFGEGKVRGPHIMYKSWLTEREVAAMIQILQRALTMMDEYYEGTLDLRSLLLEDEDAKRFVDPERYEVPDIDDAFKP